MPGIKHGFMHSICHSPPPKSSSCQAVSQFIRAMPRWGARAGYTTSAEGKLRYPFFKGLREDL